GAEFALAPAHDGRQDHQARGLLAGRSGSFSPIENGAHNLFGRLPHDGLAALRAVLGSDRGPKQAEVVVNLGDGADGRTRAAAGGFLLDGDGRAEALDGVHVRALELVEELAGVGGKRLNVAALALGIKRVERQAALARSAQAGDHGEGAARNRSGDVLQVVLARARDGDAIGGHGTSRRGSEAFDVTLFRCASWLPAAPAFSARIFAIA